MTILLIMIIKNLFKNIIFYFQNKEIQEYAIENNRLQSIKLIKYVSMFIFFIFVKTKKYYYN